jgi:hypothetical protein
MIFDVPQAINDLKMNLKKQFVDYSGVSDDWDANTRQV